MSWQFFSHYPIFRILLPFIAGILINEQLCSLPFVLIIAAVAIVVYAFIGLRLKNNPNRWNYRHLYFAPIALLALSCGAFSQYLNRPKQIDLATIENNLIVGRVNEIKYNEFSMSLKISVMSKVNHETKKVESLPVFPMILTTQGCDYTLKAGDVLIFDGEVKPITNLGNPDEMDYASYMRNNGVLYCCHTPMEKVLKIDNNPTLANSLTNLRYSLRHIIMNSSLSPPTRTFLLAILIGDDDYIDHTTREQFSNAGISHILALSGLHVGIISFIIWLLLFPLDYYHKRKLRLLLTIVALWFFAFFTGLSPSVLRATVMTTVVFGAFIFYRGQKALNSLGLAALIILVFNPLAIHQVGFQFSFITFIPSYLLLPPAGFSLFPPDDTSVPQHYYACRLCLPVSPADKPLALLVSCCSYRRPRKQNRQ